MKPMLSQEKCMQNRREKALKKRSKSRAKQSKSRIHTYSSHSRSASGTKHRSISRSKVNPISIGEKLTAKRSCSRPRCLASVFSGAGDFGMTPTGYPAIQTVNTTDSQSTYSSPHHLDHKSTFKEFSSMDEQYMDILKKYKDLKIKVRQDCKIQDADFSKQKQKVSTIESKIDKLVREGEEVRNKIEKIEKEREEWLKQQQKTKEEQIKAREQEWKNKELELMIRIKDLESSQANSKVYHGDQDSVEKSSLARVSNLKGSLSKSSLDQAVVISEIPKPQSRKQSGPRSRTPSPVNMPRLLGGRSSESIGQGYRLSSIKNNEDSVRRLEMMMQQILTEYKSIKQENREVNNKLDSIQQMLTKREDPKYKAFSDVRVHTGTFFEEAGNQSTKTPRVNTSQKKKRSSRLENGFSGNHSNNYGSDSKSPQIYNPYGVERISDETNQDDNSEQLELVVMESTTARGNQEKKEREMYKSSLERPSGTAQNSNQGMGTWTAQYNGFIEQIGRMKEEMEIINEENQDLAGLLGHSTPSRSEFN